MNTHSSYLGFHQQLVADLLARANTLAAASGTLEESQQQILQLLERLSRATPDESFYSDGQACVCKIIAAWPQLTPAVPRDLLWFFGGDCLQFMPDDEIARYQKLDEARYDAEQDGQAVVFSELRSKILGLH